MTPPACGEGAGGVGTPPLACGEASGGGPPPPLACGVQRSAPPSLEAMCACSRSLPALVLRARMDQATTATCAVLCAVRQFPRPHHAHRLTRQQPLRSPGRYIPRRRAKRRLSKPFEMHQPSKSRSRCPCPWTAAFSGCACSAAVAASGARAITARCLLARAAASVPKHTLRNAQQPCLCTSATCE